MTIKIILTSYFLTYMYGDRAYEDPLLLSREILKKAYSEGLYYISSSKNIASLMNNPNSRRTLYVFAGIPTFNDICMNLYPNEKLSALKITLPYETLADFQYDNEEKVLCGKKIALNEMVPTELGLTSEKEKLKYVEITEDYSFTPDQEEIIHEFQKEIANFRYAILTSVEYLKNLLVAFLQKRVDEKLYNNDAYLNMVKECYEELTCTKG